MLCVGGKFFSILAVHPRALEPRSRQKIGAAARYRRATANSSHDGAHPDNSAVNIGKIYSAPLYICRVVLLLLRQRRGAAGNDLGVTMKYLRQTTNGSQSPHFNQRAGELLTAT